MARERFAGKVVVVTGGAGGIGRAIAEAFANEGAQLVLLDIARAGEAAATVGKGAVGITCDLTSEAACRDAVADITARFGGIDVLVNNAGVGQRGAFARTEVAVFRRVMEVNFFGALQMTQAALGSLVARQGRIVVISSVAGFAPLLGRSGYAASKHALHGLFETLRGEVAGQGVSVTMVCPSFVDSPFETNTLGERNAPVGRPRSKVGRLASPESVAAAVVDATAHRRRLVVLTPVGKLTRVLSRLVPPLYERMMARALRDELLGPGS